MSMVNGCFQSNIIESTIINTFEKTEQENIERVTRLFNNMSSHIISRILESENAREDRIKKIVCTLEKFDEMPNNTYSPYYSHQLSPDLISQLK